MKNKQTPYLKLLVENQKLREERLFWVILSSTFLIILLILNAGLKIKSDNIYDLEQDLRSCQDKVPVWTLKVNCITEIENRGNINQTIILTYFNYEDYEKAFNGLLDDCEVIK